VKLLPCFKWEGIDVPGPATDNTAECFAVELDQRVDKLFLTANEFRISP